MTAYMERADARFESPSLDCIEEIEERIATVRRAVIDASMVVCDCDVSQSSARMLSAVYAPIIRRLRGER